jgi:hypothetical protein
MSEAVNFSIQRPDPNRVNLIERLFVGKISNIGIVTNKRIISIEEIEQSYNDGNVFYIFETSTIQGFADGGWDNVSELVKDDINFIGGSTRVLKCNPLSSSVIQNIMSDDGRYIAQIRDDNKIFLCTDMANFSIEGLEYIFGLLGYEPMDDVEYFTQKLTAISRSVNQLTIREAQDRIRREQQNMDNTFKQYMQYFDTYNKYNAMIHGIGATEEELRNRFGEKIERLLRSEHIDSLEIDGNTIRVVTKPLTIAIWNIGQFLLEYTVGTSKPTVKRVGTNEDNGVVTLTDGGGEWVGMDLAHPHVSGGSPCTGNVGDLIRAFWEQDMLTGFNFMIQYLRSYSKRGGPYNSFAHWLRQLGYVHDAYILRDDVITLVDNGIHKSGRTTMTEERLREMGCTGERITDPEQYEEALRSSRRGRNIMLSDNIEYHRLGDE